MSQPTGTQSGTEPATTQSGGEGGSASTSTDGTAGTGTQSGATTTTPPDDAVSRADYEAIQNRMRAADQKAAKFEQELKALQTKDLPEAEKLKAEYEATVQRVNALTETNRKLSLENAFLKDNTHDWQNPGAALKMADLSGVTVNEDGSVSGLKDALKKLATSEAWMLKPKAASEGGSGGTATATAQPAGVPPMNGRPDTQSGATKGLETRLPALMTRRRVKPQ